jgi:hypothetical protein
MAFLALWPLDRGSSARGAWFDHGLDHGIANAEAHYRSVVNKPAARRRDGTPGVTALYVGYRLFLTLLASSVWASARHRTIAAANAANALGVGAVTEGFAGQTTMTKRGLSSGSCSSMLSLSPERLMAPLASSVILDIGDLASFHEFVGSPGPGGVRAPTGPLNWHMGVSEPF